MANRHLVLNIVATDSTFAPAHIGGRRVWSGKCLHCNARLVVGADGALLGSATIEHILPRHHGGDDALENLALACARCNHQKGRRLDNRRRQDERLVAVLEALAARRQARWRPLQPPPRQTDEEP